MSSSSTYGDPTDPTPHQHFDVLVIGGGPAGSTIGALLAEQGRHVVVLEKAYHPRFHIGESLLPANVPLFERLGVRDQVERIGMPKWGVEFVADDDMKAQVEFAHAWNKTMPYAWQVRRADLDDILFRHAKNKGAHTVEGCRVHDVQWTDSHVTVCAQCDDGTALSWQARFVVDASGRDTFLANKLRAKTKNPNHNSAALFGHFTGARRLEGKQEGNISIFWFQHGWFWFIPLADGTTSIGAVVWPRYLKSRETSLQTFFMDTIAMCPSLARRLEGATLVGDKVYATGNYAYASTHCAGERYLMLGDAFAFIDPVFSSGVYLAMHGAFEGAKLVATHLDGTPSQATAARRQFETELRRGLREFSWFIYRVTNPTIREFFLYPQNPFRVKEALLSLLAGDIFGRTPIWRAIAILKGMYYLASVRHWRRTYAAWQRRRINIQDVGTLRGENVVEERP